jgi:hypothetical protein
MGSMVPFRRPLALVALVAALALPLAACGSDGDDAADDPTTSATSTTDPTTTASTDAATTTGDDPTTTTAGGHDHPSGGVDLEGTPVNLYWVRGEDLATGATGVEGQAVGREAIEALLAGPPMSDEISGMATMIPEGTELLGLDVADGTATIDLDATFASGGGSASMMLRVAQVVFTLTQFPTVERVEFLIDGEEVDGIGGEGLATSYDGREAFGDVTPAILIESPTPYRRVTSPITVRGMSNTFEAVASWSVRTTEGSLLAEGTTQATAGTGTWGTFEFEAELPPYEGDVVITMWQPDPSGTPDRLDVYEVVVSLS